MDAKWHERTIALAGVFQAVAVVDRLAKTGYLDQPRFQTAVASLLEQNPATTAATFGGTDKLDLGLEILADSLNGKTEETTQQSLRYALGVFHLQGKLMKKQDLLEIIASRLQQVKQQVTHFELTHDNVVGNLADLYRDTISQFRFRIHVRGDATYLQQERTAAQIRTLLFAAIRAAILWHQVGGRRWHLLFYRKHIQETARALRREIH